MMKHLFIKIFIVCFVAIALSGGFSSVNAFFFSEEIPVETNAPEHTREAILAILQKYKVIGLNFIVTGKDGEKGYGCFGYADIERKVPMKRTTIFRIASISKPIVAVALLQLVEKKKCRLNDSASAHLGFALRNPFYKKATIAIRHLLTHTSGICDEGGYDDFLRASYSDAPPPITSILKAGGIYYTKKNWRHHPPGKKFYYSNLGFGILATIIEKKSRMRFDEYCKKFIFQPLGMRASFNVDDFESVDDFAVLYSHYSDEEKKREEYKDKKEFEASMDAFRGKRPEKKNYIGWRPGFNAVVHSPQGGARVSMIDLAKFMTALMGDGSNKRTRILRPVSVLEMRKIQWSGISHNGLPRKTGLGLTITKNLIEGETLYGHSGRAYGFQGMMYFNPAKHYGIIILANGGDYYKDETGPLEFHLIEKELFTLLHGAFVASQ